MFGRPIATRDRTVQAYVGPGTLQEGRVAGQKAKILIVDDEPFIRDIISRKLTDLGYDCDTAEDAEAALAKVSQNALDCILSDIRMPGMSGIELLRRIRVTNEDVSVIMITGSPDIDQAIEAMRLGAHDHLSKPLNLDELAIIVERAIEKRRLVMENREYQRNLEEMVRARTEQLHKANVELRTLFLSSIKSLAHALEAKDQYTQGHSERVAETSVRIARFLSLADAEIENIWLAGFLHDIGKIGIRENVLNKPGKLDADEWRCVQEHPVLGERILRPIEELADVTKIVRHHHEHFDGSGYPDGLAGGEIPLGARILSVADAYDALTSKRPYRDALSREESVKVLEEGAGTQFDPVIVRAFLSCPEAPAEAPRPHEQNGAQGGVQDAKHAGSALDGPFPLGSLGHR